MSSLNRIQLIGRLGQDPEIQRFESGAIKAKFSVATNYKYSTPDGQKIEETEWHNVVMWYRLAETAEKYLKKGSQVYIEGKLKTRSWEDANTNTKKYITEIEVRDFSGLTLLDTRNSNNQGGQVGTVSAAVNAQIQESDDLPF
ncbi:MAG: single-stranded DNA-binding protein [Chitinophagales bacterium]